MLLVIAAGAAATIAAARSSYQPDFEVYTRAARAIAADANPYPHVGSAAVFSQHAFVYPYATALAFSPFGWMPHALARTLFVMLEFAALVLTAVLLSRPRERVAALALVLLSAPSLRSVQVGALGPVLCALLASSWRFRSRSVTSGVILAVAAATKLVLVPVLAWPLVTGRVRMVIAAGVSLLVLLAAGFHLGPIGMSSYRQLMVGLSAHEGPGSASLAGALRRLGIAWPVSVVAAGLAAVGLVAAFAVVYRHRADERVVFGAAIVASVVASPIVWSHYYVLVLVVILLFPLPAVRAAWFVAASWVAFPARVDISWPGFDAGPALRVLGGLLLIVAAAHWFAGPPSDGVVTARAGRGR